jgi:hypothetical protein
MSLTMRALLKVRRELRAVRRRLRQPCGELYLGEAASWRRRDMRVSWRLMRLMGR